MNQLTVKEEFSFAKFAEDVEMMTKVCKQLMATKHYVNLGEAGIFAILQKSKALNIDPFDGLNGGLYFVQGKVGMSTELMSALIRKSGHSVIKDEKSDDTICVLHGKRADNGDTWTQSFSMGDARKAGIDRGIFLKYPAIMLYNRAMSALARQLFSDVIKGCGYVKEELYEIAYEKEKPAETITEVVNVECTPDKVTEEMAIELDFLMNADLVYKNKVYEWLKEKYDKETLYDVSIKTYNSLYKQTQKHLEAMAEEEKKKHESH